MTRLLAYAASLPPVDEPLSSERYARHRNALVREAAMASSAQDIERVAQELVALAHGLVSVSSQEPSVAGLVNGRARAAVEFRLVTAPATFDERIAWAVSRTLAVLTDDIGDAGTLRETMTRRALRQRLLTCATEVAVAVEDAEPSTGR